MSDKEETSKQELEEVKAEETPVTAGVNDDKMTSAGGADADAELADTSAAPVLPKRPLTPLETAQKELADAFPNLESKLITAVLIASQGELDKSFNALLYYNDPSTLTEEELQSLFAKPKLPERNQQQRQHEDQLSQDEALARKLAKKYSRRERYNDYLQANDATDNKDTFERFMEEDLPQFRQQLNKNLEETSTKITNWFGNVSKKFNESTGGQEKLFSAIGGGNNTDPRLRTQQTTRNRYDYDYDEESITNQTSGISLSDNTAKKSETAALKEEKDIYGTPKKSVEETRAHISNVKPEPIAKDTEEAKSSIPKTEEKKKDDADDDFLVDDSDEE